MIRARFSLFAALMTSYAVQVGAQSTGGPPGVAAQVLPFLRASPWVAGTESNGTQLLAWGPLRVTMRGTEIHWADERTASRLRSATPVERGWVFVAEDGTVARSDTFLGPLQRVGEVRRSIRWSPVSAGRAVAIDRRGALWTSEGQEPMRAVESLPEGDVLWAAFRDAAHGAAVLDGGTLWRTSDGARHWTQVPLGDDAAMALAPSADRSALILRTHRAVQRLSDDGSLGPTSDTPTTRPVVLFDRAQESQLTLSLAQWNPPLAAAAPRLVRMGSDAFAHPDGRDVIVVDARSGAVRSRWPNVLPSEFCFLVGWGDTLVAGCGRTTSPWLASTDGGQHFAPVAGLRRNGAVFSDDGRHAAYVGACPDHPASGGATTLCAVDVRGGTSRPIGLSMSTPSVVSMHGATALVAGWTDGLPAFARIDGDTGASQAITPGPWRDPQVHVSLTGASMLADGQIVGTVRLSTGFQEITAMATGPASNPLRLVELPDGARNAAMLDAVRGFAIGEDAAHVWSTLDGGAHWQSVSVPASGARERIGFAADLSGIPGLRCANGSCVAGERLVLRFDGAAGAPVLTAAEAPLPNYGERTLSFTTSVNVFCTATPAPARRARRGPDAPAGTYRLAAASATVTLSERVAPSGALSLEARWRGHDDDGGFSLTSHGATLSLPASPANGEPGVGPGYLLRAATRDGVLLERCPGSEYDRHCVTIWLGRSRAAALPPPGFRGSTEETSASVIATMPSPTHGIYVLRSLREGEEGRDLDEVLELGSDGAVRSRRGFTWYEGRERRFRGLARRGGAVGLMVSDATDGAWQRFFPMRAGSSDAVDLPYVAEGAVPRCNTPARPSRDVGVTTTTSPWLVENGRAMGHQASLFEWTRTGLCVRAVAAWVQNPAETPRASWGGTGLDLRADSDGRLVGTRGLDGDEPMVCAPH